MAARDLQIRLIQARGSETRRDVVERALSVPGAPETLTEQQLRRMETTLQGPPREGAELLAVVAALGVSPFDVLRDLGYWPPLPSTRGRSDLAEILLEEAARLGGWRLQRAGTKTVVER